MIALAERTSVAACQPEVQSIRQLVDEIESLLVRLPVRYYDLLGGHIESCLGLVEALICAEPPRPIVYDANLLTRTTLDRAGALMKTRDLAVAMELWPRMSVDTVVCVDEVAWLDDATRSWSTLRAEIAWVTGKVIDRQRTVARMLSDCGLHSPEGFSCMSLPPLRARSLVPPAWPLVERLDELSTVLTRVDRDRYTTRELSKTSGSVGEHIRHCLDHIAALLAAESNAPLSYDGRQRGTAIENDPHAALQEIMRLKTSLPRWSGQSVDQPIRVASMLSASGMSVTGESTLGRELAFVISHTIHHQAMIALLLERQGLDVPDRFGHSPSTPRRH
jgi:uncharacterized damage-inducible protein DinB